MKSTSRIRLVRSIAALFACILIAGVLLMLHADGTFRHLFAKQSFPGSTIVCSIHPEPSASGDLRTGYTYHLLKEFAAGIGASADIRMCGRDEACLDSLRNGSIDILAFPYADTPAPDSVLVSIPVDSLSVWIVSTDRHKDMKLLNKWIAERSATQEHAKVRDSFLTDFYPMVLGRDSVTALSPYDSLFRVHAARMGWDWHVLAAMAYQESRFHIEAESHKGASGLMQLMPPTARMFKAENMLDPEENLRAACEYLSFLYRHYRRFTANSSERLNFTLAAYNAGEGRIDGYMDYAASQGIDSGYWSEVSGIFDSIGTFNGNETSTYVMRVNALTAHFKRICP